MPETSLPRSIGAPVWRRLMALAYDSLLLLGIWALVGFVLSYFVFHGAANHTQARLIELPALVAATWLFYTGFWMKGGQTLGMRAWRLHVLMANRQPIRLLPCLIRLAIATAGWFLGGIHLWWCFLDSDNHGLHDRLSKTVTLWQDNR